MDVAPLTQVDPTNMFSSKPLAGIPAWWRGFVFQILNGRQLSVYLYLVMLMDGEAACSPTVEEIASELGLMSTTMVFEAIHVLEEYGFILRSRVTSPNARARRNIYQRPSCEYTILRLLQAGKIDRTMREKRGVTFTSRSTFEDGLQALLGDRYAHYAIAPHEEKSAYLITALEAMRGEQQRLSA